MASFRLTPAWFASAGGATPWFEKRVADETVPDLAITDVNGDGEADVFRADLAQESWYVAPSGSAKWELLNGPSASLAVPLSELAFADLNGDKADDVFRSDHATGTWFVSTGGTDPWIPLNGPDTRLKVAISELAFGYFDGDDTADVFWTDPATGMWWVSSGGAVIPNTPLNGPDPALAVPTSQLAIADLDGDGVSDVFRTDKMSGTWHWSKSGTSAWMHLNGPSSDLRYAITDLVVADFDGDGKADVLQPDGASWNVSWGGTQPWEVLNTSCHRLDALLFGDFDGDGTTDVFRTGTRP